MEVTSPIQTASIGRLSCRPKARMANTAIRTDQSGQKDRLRRSAHKPAVVRRRGQTIRVIISFGSICVMPLAALRVGLVWPYPDRSALQP